MDKELSALFAAVASWATEVKGARDVGASGKLWVEATEPNEHFDAAVTVKMNATEATLEGIPPFTATLSNEVYFPGLMGMVDPYGGTLLTSDSEDEGRLIAHFNAQLRPQPTAA